jgi:hypothetical protein
VKRRLGWLTAATAGFVFLAWPAAGAEYRGTDVLGNIAPDSLLGGDALADRYPLSAYSLDYHTDVGITQLDGVPATIAHWASAQLWSLTSFLMKTVIDLLTWAFSLDLLGGGGGSGGQGALTPVAEAISSLYENVIGEAWMVAAVLLAGIWGVWKALVQRRYTETAGSLAVSVLFVVLALFFVYQPERTIGQASEWTNTLSLAFLSGANRGTVDNPDQAKRQVADQLFEAQIYKPWVVLNFGGLQHCVDTGRLDADGFPKPVGPHDPTRDVCRDHVQRGRDGFGGYAPRFLRYAPASDERNAEYRALKNGKPPDAKDPTISDCPRGDCSGADTRDQAELERQFAGYKVDKADAPAVDIQQAGGAFQRLTLALVVFAATLGAVALLGMLSLAVILAQVVALVLLGFAPVALIIGIFPRGGHEFFRNWLIKLATAVFIKALYSLVIAVVIAVSAALESATDSLGFLFAFALQGIFFWAIFLYRKQITARLVAATTGNAGEDRHPRMTIAQRGADVATRPFGALLAVPGRITTRERSPQESALAGSTDRRDGAAGERATGVPGPVGDDHDSPLVQRASANEHAGPSPGPDEPLPPLLPAGAAARNGHAAHAEHTRIGGPAAGNGHATASPDHEPAANGHRPGADVGRRSARVGHAPSVAAEASPRASHEDVMRRARELRERDRDEAAVEPPDRAA